MIVWTVKGEANAIQAVAVAKAVALQKVGEALTADGSNAAALSVAEQYVRAFGEIAKTSNTLILPKDAGNISSVVAQVSKRIMFVSNVSFECKF